jgi:hypothetical protein
MPKRLVVNSAKILSNKTKATAIAIFLILTITATLVALPLANAHTPPWTKATWTYLVVTPNPIGVNQEALVVFWVDVLPQTANGAYGDRYTFTVDVTAPDGSNETLGPFTSDPVGGSWTTYTPTQVGNYTFVAKFPGITYQGANPPPGGFNPTYASYINDTLQPSTSDPDTLIVQQEQIQPFEATPLPTGYWTRPINAENREWYPIAGNWLGPESSGGSAGTGYVVDNPGPSTAHIVWTKPIEFGGVAGISDFSYYTGSAYEGMWSPPIIIGGILYYNEPKAPRYGFTAVDLRTGETLWWQNSTGPAQIGGQTPAHISSTEIPWNYPRLSFGQVFEYDSPNQHGAVSYLWTSYRLPYQQGATYTYTRQNGSTYSFSAPANSLVWQMLNAFTGELICEIANVPSGIQRFGPNGEILIYTYNNNNGLLSCWNSTVALGFPNNNLGVPYSAYESTEAYYWMWREPIGRTVDGNNGYQWTVNATPGLGRINLALLDRIYGTSGNYGVSFQYGVGAYGDFALSIEPGNEGKLLWKKDYTGPPITNATMILGPMSLADKVYTVILKETNQWYGYDLDTGNKLWGPTASQVPLDMYSSRSAGWGTIAYGKLYSIGYGGILYCYDIKNGTLLWQSPLNPCGLEATYPYWPVGSGAGVSISDNKVYITTGEHSTESPLYRGWSIYCFDAVSGKNLWNFTGLMPRLAIADGYAVSLDGMDNQIYCFGKGQTATTVEVPMTAITAGSTVVLQGTVTDQSSGAKGTPAISDSDMTAWMEYLYHQRSMPKDAKGVEVSLDAVDPNGNFVHLGTATSDSSGTFGYKWTTPDVPGEYSIIATFGGSESYFASSAETHAVVSEAPVATTAPGYPQPIDYTLAIIGATVVLLVAIVLASIWIRRK